MRKHLQRGIFLLTALLILWILLTSLALRPATPGTVENYNYKIYNEAINQLYKTVADSHSPNLVKRLDADSRYFLNTRYLIGALGEGPEAQYDQSPLYRTDAFDCVTFVSTVIALA